MLGARSKRNNRRFVILACRALTYEYVEYCRERFEIEDLVEIGLGVNDLPAGELSKFQGPGTGFTLPHALAMQHLAEMGRSFGLPSIQRRIQTDVLERCLHLAAVYLHHPNGSELEVYLHGANITSWRKKDGAEVLFLRPGNTFDGVSPIQCVTCLAPYLSRSCLTTRQGLNLPEMTPCLADNGHWRQPDKRGRTAKHCQRPMNNLLRLVCRGGIPVAFPQYGRGVLPTNGILRRAHWSVADTGCSDPALASDPAPSVALWTESDESTLAVWPHKFEAMYTVRLHYCTDSLPVDAQSD